MRSEQKSNASFGLFRVISVLSMFDGAQALASECIVDGWLRGPTVATVRPTGAEPFRVALFDSTRVTASLSKGSIKLSVKEPLAFLARHSTVPLRVKSRPASEPVPSLTSSLP